jgi:hypothetical protein
MRFLIVLTGAAKIIASISQATPDWINTISDVGVVVLLLLFFYGTFLKDPPWLVRYGEHKKCLNDQEFYRDIALRSLSAAEQGTDVLKKTVRIDDR